ncbi:ArsR family transcriptional regulator [Caulobacter sp. Root655]|uniref:ArsR/SmtB family transcription factor n=1 Tax=Caulobacter sp. Root655 TaxID=1736578 RepID=UPI0006F548E2|nr:winged helix-turn-helix domain-containing protein [Caulobacter sp. Root655]KRA64687.1 ArsR family transcriptional regulator [Caulobacter sp. Root655]
MEPNIASPAALIGDPGRAAMLQLLMDGRAHPAGALAWAAGLTAQAASNHLARLVDGGLVTVEREGRHRYYRLANAEVAHALEALAVLAAPVRSLEQPRSPKARALRDGRCCYGHLAGRLGIAVADGLVDRGLIVPADDKLYAVTASGRAWFEDLGLDLASLRSKRGAARQCLDWTERRHHLAGPLGVALLSRMADLAWIDADKASRAVRLTALGRQELLARLGVDLEAVEGREAA